MSDEFIVANSDSSAAAVAGLPTTGLSTSPQLGSGPVLLEMFQWGRVIFDGTFQALGIGVVLSSLGAATLLIYDVIR